MTPSYHHNSFYKEVKNSPLCPSDWETRFAHFAEYQMLALETLCEVHRVCEKNSIPYQVTYGSLIGAIRHNGQIPWDYDTDVFVPFSEKDRLIEALKQDLHSDYYMECPEVDEHCSQSFLRVSAKGYDSDMLHVDVFYYCGAPDGKKERAIFQKNMVAAYHIRLDKERNCLRDCYGRLPRLCRLLARKLLQLPRSTAEGDQLYHALATKYPIETSRIVVTADAFADWYEIPREYLTETRLMDVDYGTIRVPVQADALLKLMYGDYMKVPPLEERLKEFMFHTDMFTRWERMNQKERAGDGSPRGRQ